MKFTKKQQGAISVFLCIILLGMFVFSAVIVDGGRIYAGKNIVSGAGQLALNSGLSTYDEALKDAYGLIAMSENVEDLEDNLNEYFVASLGTCGISEEDYNTALVYLEMAAEEGAFDAKAVPNTEVCRGYVMEQQVLDYMKYRAPITVSTGILDKIKGAKDMNQIKVVANKELETSKAANDVQKHLEKLKELVDLENEEYKEIEEAYATGFADMEEYARIVTAAQILTENYSRVTAAKTGDWDELIKGFKDEYDAAYNKWVVGGIEAYTGSYDSFIRAKEYYNGLKDLSKDEFMTFWCEKYEIDMEDDEEETEESEAGEEEEEDDGDAELYKEGEDLYDDFVEKKTDLENIMNSFIPDDITFCLQEFDAIANEIHDATVEGKRLCEEIEKRCKKIRDALANMEDKLGKWEDETGKLADANLQQSNVENQKPYKDLVDPEKEGLGELEKQAGENKTFYDELRLTMEAAEFACVSVLSVLTSDWVIRTEISEHAGSVSSGAGLSDFVYGNPFMMLYSLCDVKEKHKIDDLNDLTSVDFYEYLEKACGKDKKESEIKSANSDLSGELAEIMKELKTLMTSDDLKDIQGKLAEQNDSLPTTLMGAGAPESKSVNSEQTVNVDNTDERKNTLNNATNTLNSDNSLIEGIAKIADKGLEEIVEPVYITEYFTTMYSYYTVNKTGEKKDDKWQDKDAGDIVSLSKYDLTQDVIYRAEVEYILWGNKTNVRQNVNTTKAVIFAIQYIGNLTYALTQKDVTTGAKAIGALFPHKIVSLVVQVVVEVVVATVETVRDMVVLCNGGSVVPFKIMTQGEWRSEFNSIDDVKKWDMKKDKTSKELLAFSYKDYLWIMLCVNCLSDTKRYTMLERAADLTQVNLAKSENDSGYKLMDKSTMLQINANVEMDAWLVTDVFRNNNTGLDTSGEYTLKYRGIQGY